MSRKKLLSPAARTAARSFFFSSILDLQMSCTSTTSRGVPICPYTGKNFCGHLSLN